MKKVELVELLSYGNIYDGKNVCTKGYFVEADDFRIIKVRLDEDKLTRSAWVELGDKVIIKRQPGFGAKAVIAELCGKFDSARNGEFGEPPIWISQITVESFEVFGGVQDF